jgi:hypothetical protein
MYDFEETSLGFSMGDFEDWLRTRCSRLESRQLLSEFIVEQSLGSNHVFPVIASNHNHSFSIAQSASKLILCDFPSSSLHDSLHLDRWTFFVVDSSRVFGDMTVEELMAFDPPSSDYYMLYKLLQN